MRAGHLRHLVTIQKPGGGVNDWGEPIPGDWQDVAQLWGDLRHLSGMASIKADDEAMAVRRLGFYARCGAVDTGWTEHLFDAWFRVLVLPAEGETLDAETANKELADCYSRVMGADKWRRYVQLYRPDCTEEKF